MLEIALTSFTTFFATIGPVEAAVLFATLTPKMEQSARAAIAIRATAIAGSLLLIFPGLWSDLGGIACLVIVLLSQRAARAAGATEVV